MWTDHYGRVTHLAQGAARTRYALATAHQESCLTKRRDSNVCVIVTTRPTLVGIPLRLTRVSLLLLLLHVLLIELRVFNIECVVSALGDEILLITLLNLVHQGLNLLLTLEQICAHDFYLLLHLD